MSAIYCSFKVAAQMLYKSTKMSAIYCSFKVAPQMLYKSTKMSAIYCSFKVAAQMLYKSTKMSAIYCSFKVAAQMLYKSTKMCYNDGFITKAHRRHCPAACFITVSTCSTGKCFYLSNDILEMSNNRQDTYT
ncbi:hypothetical protein BsWGS_12970 [Bradybaena similaris]